MRRVGGGEQEHQRIRESGGPRFLVVGATLLDDDLEAIVTKPSRVQNVDQRLKCTARVSPCWSGAWRTTTFSSAHSHDNSLRPGGESARAIDQDTVPYAD